MIVLFKVVGLVARVDLKTSLKLAEKLLAHLERKGVHMPIELRLARCSGGKEVSLPLEEMKVNLIILDCHYQREIEPENPRVTITRSEQRSLFVRFNYDFYQHLKGCLIFWEGGEVND